MPARLGNIRRTTDKHVSAMWCVTHIHTHRERERERESNEVVSKYLNLSCAFQWRKCVGTFLFSSCSSSSSVKVLKAERRDALHATCATSPTTHTHYSLSLSLRQKHITETFSGVYIYEGLRVNFTLQPRVARREREDQETCTFALSLVVDCCPAKPTSLYTHTRPI